MKQEDAVELSERHLLSDFELIVGMGWTDRQTDGVQRFNVARQRAA